VVETSSVAPAEVPNLVAIADHSPERNAKRLLSSILGRDIEDSMLNWDDHKMKHSAAIPYGDKYTLLVRCAPRNDSVSIHNLKLTLFRNMNSDLPTSEIICDSNNVFRIFWILSLE
jgi:hypothetical protein